MPFLLRKVNNKNVWNRAGQLAWVPAGESEADILRDLRVDEGSLSLWLVQDDRSNLERLLGALVGDYGKVDKFDYILVPEHAVSGLRIPLLSTAGQTPDPIAKGWHRDATELTCVRLAHLAEAIRSTAEFHRVNPRMALDLVADSVTQGWINREHLSDKIRHKLRI